MRTYYLGKVATNSALSHVTQEISMFFTIEIVFSPSQFTPPPMSYSITFLRCIKYVNLPYFIPNENDGLIIPNIEIKGKICAMIITTLCLHCELMPLSCIKIKYNTEKMLRLE